MIQTLSTAARMLLVMTALTGVAYPLLVTGVAQVAFPAQANGSLIRRGEAVVGSRLIGQPFDAPRYFRGRPSATSQPYDAGSSTGSNLSPAGADWRKAVDQRVADLKAANPGQDGPVPIELVAASASGLDPHLGPAAANYQVGRVARARGLSEESVARLLAKHTTQRPLGLLGEPVVNVLELNLELDAAEKAPAP